MRNTRSILFEQWVERKLGILLCGPDGIVNLKGSSGRVGSIPSSGHVHWAARWFSTHCSPLQSGPSSGTRERGAGQWKPPRPCLAWSVSPWLSLSIQVSVSPQPGSSSVSRAGSLHKSTAQPEEKKPETAASRLERREQLKKANTLPTSVTGREQVHFYLTVLKSFSS